jgi:16S rRNA (guanine966-N2)-methyltransferase
MRIISGKFRGKIIHAPTDLPVRPTTDFAKTGLFNYLSHRFELDKIKLLDLCTGTGNISMEFASRGCKHITAVDNNMGCIHFTRKMLSDFGLPHAKVIRYEAIRFLEICDDSYDLIFADPPYESDWTGIIPQIVIDRKLIRENGLCILEHVTKEDYSDQEGFLESRKYGNSTFSFFGNIE